MRDAELVKTFNRRTVILAGGQFVLFSVLIGRMYYLQVMEADKYKKLSDKNRIRIKFIPPSRGKILDRNGTILADNVDSYSIELIPEVAFEKINTDDLLDAIGKIIKITDKDKEKIKKDIRRKKSFLPVLIKENLSWNEMAKLQVKNLDFKGVYVEKGELRVYPKKEIASHVIGYVGRVSEKELKQNTDPLLELPNFRIGKTGVEKYHDLLLRGERGEVTKVVNSSGRMIEELKDQRKKALNGKDLTLTIDSRLQEYAYNRIKDKSVSAIVMDVFTGDILLMISVPSYDPNIFNTKPLSSKEFDKILNDKSFPFMNKSIEGLYAPGSTFKMMSALAGLESGEFNSSRRISCKGYMDYAGHRYHCWSTHGSMNLVNSLKHSCDIYYYNLALEVGIEKIRQMAYKFGFGEKTGIDLANEKQGQVPGKEWKKKNKGNIWFHGDSAIASIGQGFTLTSPLQLAVMTSRIANGGFAVTPRIAKLEEDNRVDFKNLKEEDILFPKLEGIDPYNLKLVKKGMYAVVNREKGTAPAASFYYKGARMSGKTGTTQVKRITMKERAQGITKQEDLPWKYRSHALFVGYAPHKNPRYSVSVVVEHGVGGGLTAAPIARDLMLETLKLYT